MPPNSPDLELTATWMSSQEADPRNTEIARASKLLVERAIAGDHAAFEQIVREHERRILTLALRLLGNMPDARDASQETFLKAFRYLHRFDTSRPPGPWLMGIAVNVCRDLGRRPSGLATPTLDISEVEGALASSPGGSGPCNPYGDLVADERKQLLHTALGQLPHRERAAIVLRDIEGMTTKEVAGILGSRESTIRAQISSARLKLRKALGALQTRPHR